MPSRSCENTDWNSNLQLLSGLHRWNLLRQGSVEALPGGVPVPLFPWNKSLCSPVPENQNHWFPMFPVPQTYLFSLIPLSFRLLFPYSPKKVLVPCSPNPWEGLSVVLATVTGYFHFSLSCVYFLWRRLEMITASLRFIVDYDIVPPTKDLKSCTLKGTLVSSKIVQTHIR